MGHAAPYDRARLHPLLPLTALPGTHRDAHAPAFSPLMRLGKEGYDAALDQDLLEDRQLSMRSAGTATVVGSGTRR